MNAIDQQMKLMTPMLKESGYSYVLFLAKEGSNNEVDAALSTDAKMKVVVCMVKSMANAMGISTFELCTMIMMSSLAFDSHNLNEDGTPKDITIEKIKEMLKRFDV